MKKSKKSDVDVKKKTYPSAEDMWEKYSNRYEGILALIEEAERLFELTGEKPSLLAQKSIDNLIFNSKQKEEKCKE